MSAGASALYTRTRIEVIFVPAFCLGGAADLEPDGAFTAGWGGVGPSRQGCSLWRHPGLWRHGRVPRLAFYPSSDVSNFGHWSFPPDESAFADTANGTHPQAAFRTDLIGLVSCCLDSRWKHIHSRYASTRGYLCKVPRQDAFAVTLTYSKAYRM